MSVKLGANDAAFRLGNQAVSVYLGAVEVYAPGVTLYFDGAVDGDWAEVGNWWLDSGHTVAAPSLPAAGDSVIATANISDNSGGAVTVANFELDGVNININIAFTVSGLAVWKTNAWMGSDGALTGNAEWNGTNGNAGTINGNATFNDTTFNDGTVTGNATFNGSGGIGGGTVTGTTTNNR
jgi:hypothetical protein